MFLNVLITGSSGFCGSFLKNYFQKNSSHNIISLSRKKENGDHIVFDLQNPIPNNYRGNNKTDETARYNFYFNTTDIGIQPNTVDGFAAPAAPAPILTYQENLLILAEAGFRTNGFITGLENLNNFRN